MFNSKVYKSLHSSLKKKISSAIDVNFIVLLAAVSIFIIYCIRLEFIQDDAFISFRYAANYLNGHGLVFNIGEKVEGYTNFLWIVLLSLFHGLFNIEYITIARIIGITSGEALFLFLYLLLVHHYGKVPPALFIAVSCILLSNLSIAYWSIAGLESTLFTSIILAIIISEYKQSYVTVALLIIATLLRPEGALVFVIILINRFITERKIPWIFIFIYTVTLLPYAVFKFLYYGALVPNTYYAKSGLGWEYFKSGIHYLWLFTSTIGVYGIIFLAPIMAIRKLWSKYSLLYIFVFIYITYVVVVGGDVLNVYRFFIPVIPVLYFLFVVSIGELISLIRAIRRSAYHLVVFTAAIFSFASYSLSYEYILTSRNKEIDLMNNMHFMSTMMKKYMGANFSVAASTIGMLGYQLLGHRVIDVLGLTDYNIAHNAETLAGMPVTWKERRYNTNYLLMQQPDFILFSTGAKPSAPAERALLIHSEFRHNYSLVGFRRGAPFEVVWRRRNPLDISRDIIHPDAFFVEKLAAGLSKSNQYNLGISLSDFLEAQQRLGEDFTLLSVCIGNCYLKMGKIDSAKIYLQKALLLDSLCWEAHLNMIDIAKKDKDTTMMLRHLNCLIRQSPWIFDKTYKPIGNTLTSNDLLK